MRLFPVVALVLLALAALPPPAVAANASVSVTNFSFSPSSVTISEGESVTWNWNSGTHSVVFTTSGAPSNCGTTSSGGAPCVRTFPTAGTFSYVCGLHGSMTGSVTVQGVSPPANQAPTASFVASASLLSVSVDASASSDADGSIASYAWSWGDGQSGSGVTASHSYASAGTFTVGLVVTDDDGATASTSRTVTATAPPPANAAPVADFTFTQEGLVVRVNGSTSRDSDGSIASYTWEWGDATPNGAGSTALHTYAAPGSYQIRLTVRDNGGEAATRTATVAVSAPEDGAPVASFSAAVDGLVVVVDATASTDDGGVASFEWAWGDGDSGAGPTAEHAYARAGTYTITLTARDAAGHAGTATRSVTVDAHPIADFDVAFRGRAVTVTSRASDPEGAIASIAWDWGDGSVGAAGATATHAYATRDAVSVRLTVTDVAGHAATATRALAFPPNQAPTAAIVLEQDDAAVVLSAVVADPDGAIASVAWDLGDGALAEGNVARHTYPAPGAYVVTMTALDDEGSRASATATVTISAPAPTAPPTPTATASAPPTARTTSSPAPSETPGLGVAALLVSLGTVALAGRRR